MGNYMKRAQLSRLEQEVTRLISRVFIHLDDSDRQLMRMFGLTVTQYWALVHLEDGEGRSLSELANLLICDKSNVTSIVDKLEAAGLAERRHGKAGDRRYTRVVLTQQGQQLRKSVMTARDHLVESRLGSLGTGELHQLILSLQHIADVLQAQFDGNEIPNIIGDSMKQSQTSE
jgi:DNA-binding MarR family transcriptional regulator